MWTQWQRVFFFFFFFWGGVFEADSYALYLRIHFLSSNAILCGIFVGQSEIRGEAKHSRFLVVCYIFILLLISTNEAFSDVKNDCV